MTSMLLVKRRLANVIKKFKFEELESAVMPVFPEISWTRVRSKLIKNHEQFAVSNVVRVIEDILDDVSLRVKDLSDRLITLEVINISRHQTLRIWYGYELIGPNEVVKHLTKQKIQEDIKQEYRLNQLNVDVKAVTYNNVMFIYVKEREKKKKKRGQHTRPTFFALLSGQKYFFCSKKNVSPIYLKIIAVKLGYNNSKRMKLMGRDLRSLIKILQIKRQSTLRTENISQPTIYRPSNPVVSNNSIDYTQNTQRRKYADQCFGKDPPILEKLVIKGPKESIKHNVIASRLPTNSIRMNWEFRSHNIPKFLTALVEKRAFTLPLPNYVSDFITLGKNDLTLEIDQQETQT